MMKDVEKNGLIYGKETDSREVVANVLMSAESIVIASHEGPEPDAIGSSVGLGLALESVGKRVWIYNKDKLESAKFLPGYSKVKNHLPDFIPDIFCVVDCANLDRIGKVGKEFAVRTTIVNIDHHLGGDRFGTFNYVDPTAPACGVLVYEVIREMSINITPDIATNLYAAIAKDTMGFLLPTVTPRAMRVAADLVEKGADIYKVMRTLKYTPFRKYKLLSEFLSRVEVHDGVAMSYLRKEDYNKFGATEEDSDDFVDMIRFIEGVKAAIFVREKKPGLFKVSMRSDPHIDVSEIARKYGGGGHKNAAGFNVEGNVDVKQIMMKVKDEILMQEKKAQQETLNNPS